MSTRSRGATLKSSRRSQDHTPPSLPQESRLLRNDLAKRLGLEAKEKQDNTSIN
jgi:hypothetical protein